MFKSTEIFKTLGFSEKISVEGITIYERKDGYKREKLVFDTVNQCYRFHLFVYGREVPQEWIEWSIHQAINEFIKERQWK